MAGIAEKQGVCPKTIQRYISLNKLIPEFVALVDERNEDKNIGLSVAFHIAQLSLEQQHLLYQFISNNRIPLDKLTVKKAEALRRKLKEQKVNDCKNFSLVVESIFEKKENHLNGLVSLGIFFDWSLILILSFLIGYVYLLVDFIQFCRESRKGKYDSAFKKLGLSNDVLIFLGLKTKNQAIHPVNR